MERARRDVCLRATEPGRGDRQPGLPEYLSRLGHNAGQATKKGVFAVLHPTLQQHPVSEAASAVVRDCRLYCFQLGRRGAPPLSLAASGGVVSSVLAS